jgi:hypothetical protein
VDENNAVYIRKHHRKAKNTMLSEISPFKKDKHCMTPLIAGF